MNRDAQVFGNRQRAGRLFRKAKEDLLLRVSRGAEAAAIFLANRVRDVINVSAPKRRLPGGGYFVTQRATPGAPIRRVTGRARASVYSLVHSTSVGKMVVVGVNARSDRGFNYGRFHEEKSTPRSGNHPFLRPTANEFGDSLRAIVGNSVKVGYGV